MQDSHGRIGCRRRPSVMFAPVLQVCLVLFKMEAQRSGGGAASSEMDRPGAGEKHKSPALFLKPVTPVEVLPIHEKLAVQGSYILECLAARHPKPSIEYFHILSAIVWKVSHQKTPGPAGSLKQPVQGQRAAEKIPKRGVTHGRAANAAVRPDHLWSKQSNVGIAIHVGKDFVKAPSWNDDIRIYKRNVIAVRMLNADVVSPCESTVLIAPNQMHLR